MKWIQRYVQAARPYFPAAQREDLCAELSAQLQDQLDELNPETEADAEAKAKALVQSFGNPMEYAGRFHSRQALISQPLLEIYKLTLQNIAWVLIGVFAGYALLHALSHTEVHPVLMVLFVISNSVEHFVWFFASVTAVFYFAEAPLQKMLTLKDWRADQLAPVRPDWSQRSRGESAFYMVVNLIFAGMVFGWFPALENISLRFEDTSSLSLIGVLTPVIGGLILLYSALHLYHCLRPYWDNPSLIANMLLNTGCILVIALLLTVPDTALPQVVSDHPGAEKIMLHLNQALASIFLFIGAVSVYEVVRDARRWRELRQRAAH